MRRSKINNGLISTFGAQIPSDKRVHLILKRMQGPEVK
jgi:hypothetical protein